MKKQKIVIETNGTHRSTKLYIDGNRIYFDSLTINGDKTMDYDIVIGLSQSKATKGEVKGSCSEPVVGYSVEIEEDEDDE